MLVSLDRPAIPRPSDQAPGEGSQPTPQAPGGVPYPWEGADNGMAADGINRSALTIQQEVPNIGAVETAPRTSVNPTHEQGWGRAPGWQWGWMKKAIPTNQAFGRNGVKRIGQTRAEIDRNSGTHAPGSGKWQAGQATRTAQRGNLQQPETAYLTAAITPIPTWGEPV